MSWFEIRNEEIGAYIELFVGFDPCPRKNAQNTAVACRAEECGFIISKDRKIDILYTNDLNDTPRQDSEGQYEYTVMCVHKLSPLNRWLETEAMKRTTIYVPAPVVAYNLFMNSVDDLSQLWSTNTIRIP